MAIVLIIGQLICSPFYALSLLILAATGAARGTLGTHTLQNPTTGAVIVTWHEIDTSKVRRTFHDISLDPWSSARLTSIASGHFPTTHNCSSRNSENERRNALPPNFRRPIIQDDIPHRFHHDRGMDSFVSICNDF